MADKSQFRDYRHLQEAYLSDIDLSGGTYLEFMEKSKSKIDVTITNFGKFYKASIDGIELSKEKLFRIIGLENLNGMRLDFYLSQFQKKSTSYSLCYSEIDVT